MPRWERTIDINATPEAVWAVMAEIERWPEWTPSILSVKPVGDSQLVPGAQARVHAKGTPESTYTVTEVSPNRSFTWTTSVRGAKTVAGHVISPAGNGSRVTLSVEVGGLAGTIFKPLISKTITTNLDHEAEGLKRRAEAAA